MIHWLDPEIFGWWRGLGGVFIELKPNPYYDPVFRTRQQNWIYDLSSIPDEWKPWVAAKLGPIDAFQMKHVLNS